MKKQKEVIIKVRFDQSTLTAILGAILRSGANRTDNSPESCARDAARIIDESTKILFD